MRLIFRDEKAILRINGELVKMSSNDDVELELPNIDRLAWLKAELERIEKGGE